jgi:hypothetical protein
VRWCPQHGARGGGFDRARRPQDEEREERIHLEIIADASGPEEQAASWYAYLSETLRFPFPAHCTALRAISPLEPGDEFDVVGIAPEEECQHEMCVLIRWRPHELAVPLMQVAAIQADEETQQPIEDWHDWVQQGYQL